MPDNYIRISCGREVETVCFDTLDRESVLRAIDRAGVVLKRYGTSMGEVLRSRGRRGAVDAAVYRACPNLPLPVVGVVVPGPR